MSLSIVAGQRGDRVAVILPGTGSSADFITRAFGPPLARAGYALATADPEPGARVVDAAFETLDEAARRYDVAFVGGVSLGAHVALRWAAARPGESAQPAQSVQPAQPARHGRLAGLLLALPAWTGPPGAVAAASTHAAALVRRRGPAGALAEARRHAVGWVADELARAWPAYGAALGDTLEAAARSTGPSGRELSRVGVPVGLAAFVDDPLHPLSVAEQWAATLPCAALERVGLTDCADPGADPAVRVRGGRGRWVLGDAALRAWHRAHPAGAPPADVSQ